MRKIIFRCKKCKWSASIIADWATIQPQRCGNRSCGTSFLKFPEELLVIPPEPISHEVISGQKNELNSEERPEIDKKRGTNERRR